MFQRPGDFCFRYKPSAAVFVVSKPLLDLLNCNFSIEFPVVGHRDFTQPPFGVSPQDLKTLPKAKYVGNRF
jgi:hypothetical protein